jgi:hypothetical protein
MNNPYEDGFYYVFGNDGEPPLDMVSRMMWFAGRLAGSQIMASVLEHIMVMENLPEIEGDGV